MRLLLACLILVLPAIKAVAEDHSQTSTQLSESTEKLEKEWNTTRKEFTKKFKQQMPPIERKIKELKDTVDNGDPKRRQEINSELAQMKELREWIRQNYHQITAMSVVNIGAVQKYFKNAKDDTKD
jgi:hypothetical protein